VLNADPKAGKEARIVIMTPRGRRFDQETAEDLAAADRIVMICGHYEGIDERIYGLATDEVSVGDFVLSGGEPAALAVLDGVSRLIPGVLGSGESLAEESFAGGVLEYPQYTRPREFNNMAVPDVLLSGNHARISRWRREQAISMTAIKRPDLLAGADLTDDEKELAEGILKRSLKGRKT
jgi:tRNA (guanine37-N1)-methyltransferase